MSRLPRAENVLPLVILLAAIVLVVSEFTVAFEFTPPGAEALQEQTAADRHNYAMIVLAAFALAATFAAILTGARPAAAAVAGAGGIALLVFLIADLPDAGATGSLEDFVTARAEPQIGFWLEAVATVALAVAGIAFATLSSEQLRTPISRLRRNPKRRNAGAPPAEG